MSDGLLKILVESRRNGTIHVREWLVPTVKDFPEQSISRGFHEGMTYWVYHRLMKHRRERAVIEMHHHYKRQTFGVNYEGEFDVFRITGRRGPSGRQFADYYEIKSYHTPEAERRAIEQFRRANNAHPEYHWRYVLITPDRVKRFSNKDVMCAR